MKSFRLLILGVAFVALQFVVLAQDSPKKPDKPIGADAAEVLRRGDSVRSVGEGPRGAADDAIVAATAPPLDDSNMWYITVFTAKNAESNKLRQDFNVDQTLAAFVSVPSSGRAWAHFNEYDIDDATQADRLKRYKLRDASGQIVAPVIVVQPPRNGMWGDSRTVVSQHSGYDGDAKKLASKITAAVKLYAGKMSAQGYPHEIASIGDTVNRFANIGEGGMGAAQQRQVAPPFSPPVPVNPFAPSTPASNPWPDANPNIPNSFPPTPVVQPAPVVQPTPANPLGGLAAILFSPGFGVLIMICLQLAHLYVLKTPSTADDKILEMIEGVLKQRQIAHASTP